MASVTQHVLAGRGVPHWTPAVVGTHYCDKDANEMYISVGTDSPMDWVNVSSGLPDGAENGQIIQRVAGGYVWITPAGHVDVDYVDMQDQALLDAAKTYVDSKLGVGFASVDYVNSGDLAVVAAAKAYIDAGIINVGSGVPAGGLTGQVMTKLSGADGDATWNDLPPPGATREFLDNAVSDEIDYIDLLSADVKELPEDGDSSGYLAKIGDEDHEIAWVPFLKEVRAIDVLSPLGGEETPDVVTIVGSPYAVLHSNNKRSHREFQVDFVGGDYSAPLFSFVGDVDSVQTGRLPVKSDLILRVRDLAVGGEVSEWAEIDFKTRDVYNEVVLSTNAIGGVASDPLVLSVEFSTVGGVDHHVATDWVLKENGVVVWSSLNDVENLTEIEVPAGILVDSNSYDVEVRAVGQVYGTSAWVVESLAVSAGFNGLVVPHYTRPFVTIYQQDQDTFTKRANPAVLPTSTGNSCSFSPDGVYLAVAHTNSPYITIYKRSGDVFTKLADPAGLPTGNGYGCSFSPDGVYLAVAHDTSPNITIYKRSGDVFTKLADPAGLPTGNGYGCSFSPDGVYLAVAHLTSPRITIYKRSGDVFTKLANPAVMPANTGFGCSFSPDGVYLAVAHTNSPYITFYERSGDVFTKLANPAELPTGVGRGCSFSPDGVYLAVAHDTSPHITIYKRSGDVFTKLTNPAVLPTGAGRGCSFSPDGVYLAVAHYTSPYITIYKRSGDVFTKLANPAGLPTGNGQYSVAWYYQTLPVIGPRATR